MSAAIAIPFRIATTALRQRTGLRDQTAELMRTAAAARVLGTVGTRFPAAVLGGELLNIMSAQLRERLQSPSRAVEPEDGHKTRRGGGWRGASARPPFQWTAVQHPEERRAAPAMSPRRELAVRHRESAAAAPRSHGGTAGFTPIAVGAGREWDGAAVERTVDADWAAAAPPSGHARLVGPSGTVMAKLRQYWDLERRRAAERPTSEALDVRPGRQRQHSAPSEPRPAVDLTRFANQAGFAERLQGFVSGRGTSGSAPPGAAWTDAAAAGAGGRVGNGAPPVPTPPQGDDFAERLAQTLRVQALHYGIDVT
jgi:hypothetical protein